MPSRKKQILVLDFDGVLHSYTSSWKGAHVAGDPPTHGAMDFLREAMQHFEVHILSARSQTPEGRRVMHSWILGHYGTHFGLTFDQALQELKDLHFPISKPHAHISIDDRAMQFTGFWPSMNVLKEFKPWNRTNEIMDR